MNITVLTFEGRTVVRPDTTRIKDNEDAWLPDGSEGCLWTPVIYTRLDKSGKSIAREFAGRYFSSVNAGILIYPRSCIDGSAEGYASACCIDHTSALRLQFTDGIPETAVLGVEADGKECFRASIDPGAVIAGAISETSRGTLLRLGDIVAAELSSPSVIVGPAPAHFKGHLDDFDSFDFIIHY